MVNKAHAHFCDGSINAKMHWGFRPLRWHLFQERQCVFQQDNLQPHSAHITEEWLEKKRVGVPHWSACSPDLSPRECVKKFELTATTLYFHTWTCTWNTSLLGILNARMLFKCVESFRAHCRFVTKWCKLAEIYSTKRATHCSHEGQINFNLVWVKEFIL